MTRLMNAVVVCLLAATAPVMAQERYGNLTGTAIAHNVTAEEFERLPKGHSFQALALTSPSVNTGTLEGGFQVNGASGAENSYVIDGISTSSLIDCRARQDAVFEYLREVQVKTGGLEAESSPNPVTPVRSTSRSPAPLCLACGAAATG